MTHNILPAALLAKIGRRSLLFATITSIVGWLACHFVAEGTSARADDARTKAPKPAAPDRKAIGELIKKLGDDEFAVRDAAAKRLQAIGEPALDLVRKAAEGDGDAEVRQNARLVLRAIAHSLFGEVRRFDEKHVGVNGVGWSIRVALTPNGKQAVSVGFDALRLWDIKTGKQALTFGLNQSGYWSASVGRDGKRVIAGGGDGIARVFELKTGKLVQQLAGHTNAVWGAVLLPDGKEAVTGAWDQSLRVWNVTTGKETRRFANVRGSVRCLALSPGGKLVAAGHFAQINGPGTVRLWDVAGGKEIQTFEGHTQEVTSVGFSADGATLVSSGFDGTVRLWDVKTGKQMKLFKAQTRAEGAALTKDGKRLLACGPEVGPTLRMWDVATGTQLFESDQVPQGFLSIAILPDDHHCVTTCKDGTVRLWQWKK